MVMTKKRILSLNMMNRLDNKPCRMLKDKKENGRD